ncbi:hypothetical protein HG535_0A06940 [Zygotorulaspora mrakii]|uniref:Vacuolar protein sorting-associated protein 27 n=1 Tax=Zygotorulaspora mrakii TaxID=42260 RepID=A0A7H9AYU6_ZYGMR|nr:uncharacterized protein HG535_0A06940 [Zygotorulaspora mrakii]QLG70752.1 hypothetical protein HG535_0A06940 [Zygotorulaspora mrakii]
MSVNTTTELDALILKATSESIPNGELDLPPALEISDVLRSRRVSPKDGMRCLKKRVMATVSNPNTQLSTWKLIDICIKNGGIPFIKEICSREFMDTMENTIIKGDKNDELQELVSGMFYDLYLAFHGDSQLNYVAKVHDKLVRNGIHFPEKSSQDGKSAVMFDSRTPADWVDSDACMICSKKFSLLTRRHHCRSCGGVFCQDHSSNFIVLPDLGIYEAVRVCDNCFEDYNMKKGSGGKKKHHRSKKSKRKTSTSRGVEDYEDEEMEDDLRKAIELSLKESRGNVEPIIPIMERTEQKSQPKVSEEQEDPDLKAAIEASLREAAEEKKRREHLSQPPMKLNSPASAPPSVLTYNLTATEEEDIHLFASLVERMKTQSPAEILENSQLQALYQKVINTRPKLNGALNDAVQKYNMLMDMNTKISDIMNIYDELLERQLKNINLSERYSLPQAPSDPYLYYQKETAIESATAPVQAYQTDGVSTESNKIQYQPQQQYQYLQPQRERLASSLPQPKDHQYKTHPQLTHESEILPQSPYPPQTLAQQNNHAQSPVQMQQQQQQPYSNEMLEGQAAADPSHPSMSSVLSEPPYPMTEEETSTQEQSQRSNDGALNGEKYSTQRRLSNSRPYPLEDEDGNKVTQQSATITNFDFPTVPIKKVVEPQPLHDLPSVSSESQAVPTQSEEPLLIDL